MVQLDQRLFVNLEEKGFENVYWVAKDVCDLRDKNQVQQYFEQAKPDYVFLAAAKVGGIMGNKLYPAEFIYDNLMIQTNVIDASYRSGVRKLIIPRIILHLSKTS